MDITLTTAQARIPVTVLHLQGKLDGSNYKELINKAQELMQGGTRALLVDLAGVDFMSSAGMVALLSIAKLLKGQIVEEEGWSLLHSAGRELSHGRQNLLKLCSPQPRIAQALEIAGFDLVFDIFSDSSQALAAF
jgi:anti-anti-sigma factor